MTVEKVKNMIVCTGNSKVTGFRINLDDGTIFYLTTDMRYKRKEGQLILQHYVDNYPGFPVFYNYIHSASEALAILTLYAFSLNIHYLGSIVDGILALQNFYNRNFKLTYSNVAAHITAIEQNSFNRTHYINYLVKNNIPHYKGREVDDYKLFLHNIDINDYEATQKSILRYMVCNDFSKDQIYYVVRKMKSEHIHLVLSTARIAEYFTLCELTNEKYNQKNFLNAYAKLRRYQADNKNEIAQKKVKAMQRDIFKFDTEEFECTIPTTPQEFKNMG